ncbi:hypothetical protein DFJ74DRAFT_771342 [Hyaloraphidium curvatum]|nr:hypothetical protein DFJ74DRAFT_771342 [Hyaloraphidium curvatum]
MALPPRVASTVVWTRPSFRATIPSSDLLVLVAIYYVHVFLPRAPITGWATRGSTRAMDPNDVSLYFDLRALTIDPPGETEIVAGRSYM